jgi:hypothetical protein
VDGRRTLADTIAVGDETWAEDGSTTDEPPPARAAGATLFIANDRRTTPTARLEVAYLDEMTA